MGGTHCSVPLRSPDQAREEDTATEVGSRTGSARTMLVSSTMPGEATRLRELELLTQRRATARRGSEGAGQEEVERIERTWEGIRATWEVVGVGRSKQGEAQAARAELARTPPRLHFSSGCAQQVGRDLKSLDWLSCKMCLSSCSWASPAPRPSPLHHMQPKEGPTKLKSCSVLQ